jgi:ribosomal protein S18 acetylase RimI-like enzyme
MSVRIRRAKKSDLDQLVALWQELAEFHAALDPHLALAPDAASRWRESVSQWLEDDNWRMLLAEEDDAAIGFVSASIREMPPVFAEKYHGVIADAIVTAARRRRGIGGQLYRAMADWFREGGVGVVELNAAVANPISQAFWRSVGFNDHMLRMRGEVK